MSFEGSAGATAAAIIALRVCAEVWLLAERDGRRNVGGSLHRIAELRSVELRI